MSHEGTPAASVAKGIARALRRVGLMDDWRTNDRGRLGRQGERLAARHLRRRGLRILARNVSSEAGEIDLVAADGDTIVFVEVKTRRSLAHGDPESAVDRRKRRHIRAAARAYLRDFRRLPPEQECRFDIVAIDCDEGAARPRLRHTRGAFAWKETGDDFVPVS